MDVVTRPSPDARLLDVLAFERDGWTGGGSKDQAIRLRFAMSSARYHQLLDRLIDLPEALALDPTLVRRLRRLRDGRRQQLSHAGPASSPRASDGLGRAP